MTDNVLTLFGIALSVVGIVLFVRTKVSEENSMQMLGLQVKVSNPSLLIFFAGILLVLVPRLLPHQPEPVAEAEASPEADAPAPPEDAAAASEAVDDPNAAAGPEEPTAEQPAAEEPVRSAQ